MNKVCFVSVYFGNIPDSMELFFKSCSWNLKFDWLFVSDQDVPFQNISSNIRCIKMLQEDFRKRLSSVCGWEVPVFKPYKVCDFRPAFGEIFAKEIKDYEFWGISDTDMILGDLSKFISDDLLEQFDKIYTVGHLSIVRNDTRLNSLYKTDTPNSRNYGSIFSNPLSCIFDEYEGFTEKVEDSGFKVYKEKDCADVYQDGERIKVNVLSRVRLIQNRNNYLEYCEKKNYKYQIFVLNKGRIVKYFINNGLLETKEYSYIHKVEFNERCSPHRESKYIITTGGLVNNDKFFELVENGNYDLNDFMSYNRPNLVKEAYRFVYLYIRLNARIIRKKILPRKNEM